MQLNTVVNKKLKGLFASITNVRPTYSLFWKETINTNNCQKNHGCDTLKCRNCPRAQTDKEFIRTRVCVAKCSARGNLKKIFQHTSAIFQPILHECD